MSTSTGGDKATINNYRQMEDAATSCYSCTRKQAVPCYWCTVIDRQARPHMLCDQHTLEAN